MNVLTGITVLKVLLDLSAAFGFLAHENAATALLFFGFTVADVACVWLAVAQ